MLRRTGHPRSIRLRRKRGVALLMCVFIVAVSSLLLLGILQSSQTQVDAIRNTLDFERAVQMAGAGVNHAIVTLENNPGFTGPLPVTEFPRGSGMTYSAEVARTGPSTVTITGVGTSGDVSRKLEVTVGI